MKRLALLGLCSVFACSSSAESADPRADDCADEVTCAANDDLTQATPPFALTPPMAMRFPIVLHHGFNASTTNSWAYYRVKEVLERDGQFVVLTEVEPFAGVEVRARRLATQLDAARAAFCQARRPNDAACLTNTKVNLVAHSMGGLDARYLVSVLGYGDRVASVTTISSPHRGTAVADFALKILPDSDTHVGVAINALASAFGRTFTQDELARDANVRAAMESLAESRAEAFAQRTPNDPRVFYQSWAGVSRAIGGPRYADAQQRVLEACEGRYFGSVARADFMAASLVAGAPLVGRFGDAPQDGMVTVESAKWGVFRGCYPADHLDQVGQRAKDSADPYTKFDHRVFFRNLATDLAARGY